MRSAPLPRILFLLVALAALGVPGLAQESGGAGTLDAAGTALERAGAAPDEASDALEELADQLPAEAPDAPADGAADAATGGAAGEAADAEPQGTWVRMQASADHAMGKVNGWIAGVFFFDIWIWDNGDKLDDDGQVVLGEDGKPVLDKGVELPFTVFWLILGAVFFTVRMGFINFRAFGHAIQVVRGRFTNPKEKREGEVSHFQALSAALSATVGLGNIAGVAIAVGTGGPGATFWMVLAGLLGMSSKFTECSLGQMYKERRADGSVMGGAMYYLSKGLKEKGMAPLGLFLAGFFTILCIGGSLAGGNSFQVRQSLDAIALVPAFSFLQESGWIYGVLMTAAVGFVIIGGLKRIAQVAEKVVPSMCVIYILACLAILLMNFSAIPDAIATIISGAFNPDAMYGGFIGVLILGFKRAAFSNEAGIGSAAIAHSAAHTEYPVREGIVALLEPFIDTVVVCTMTALVIVITGAYDPVIAPQYQDMIAENQGAALTSAAMGSQISWFPYVLAIATALFAFSTMISWSYYGERCWAWMFGDRSSLVYKIIFLIFTFLGSVVTATNVLEFGDLMILGMALPNVLGVLILSGKVKGQLGTYMTKLRNGEFETYK